MTDTPDPSRLLASAALDNEVAPDERAQVEASPALMAEMQTYASIRDELAEVEVPAAARESAIAAALAAFDALDAGDEVPAAAAAAMAASSPEPAPAESVAAVVPLHARRQRQYRWLGGAAAAAIVGVLTVAALNSGGSNDDSASLATEEIHVDTDSQTARSTGEDSELSTMSGGAADDAAGDAAATTVAAAAVESAPEIAAQPVPEGAADTYAADTSEKADPWAGAPAFTTPSELTGFAFAAGSPLAIPSGAGESTADSTAATTAETSAATETTAATAALTTTSAAAETTQPSSSPAFTTQYAPCDTGELPTVPVYYMGVQVLLVRNDALGQLQVVDPATCAATFIADLP